MAFLIYDLSIAMLLNLWCNKRFKMRNKTRKMKCQQQQQLCFSPCHKVFIALWQQVKLPTWGNIMPSYHKQKHFNALE